MPNVVTEIAPVLVIGTGLIGTSIALSLTRAGTEVWLEDVSSESLDQAIAMAAGTEIPSAGQPKVVVVAVPPVHAARVIADASQRFPGATVTDVTSIKQRVLEDAIAAGADARRLVGGHPMAGREVSGPAGARVDLLDDRVWILTPVESTDVDHLRQAHRVVTACGAYAIEMSVAEHDQAVALVSHTPQVLSSVLAGRLVAADEEQVRIAGQGLRDMTRIAASQSNMWSQILAANAEAVADVVGQVASDLSRTEAALRALAADPADSQAQAVLTHVLEQGTDGQARIPGKHGAAATRYAEVEVMVADRAGELARLFVAAGDAGINLEDVRIEHVLGRPSGLVGLSVRPEAADALIQALQDRAFDVRT